MLHDKSHGAAGLAASEAFEYSLCRGDRKTRSLFMMERAAGDIIGAPSAERDKIAYHLLYPYGIEYLLYRSPLYHNLQKYNKETRR